VYWVYKCNSRNRPHQVMHGDWRDFFATMREKEWGSTQWIPALGAAQPGDTVLAYQTNLQALVGLARVVRLARRGRFLHLFLRPTKVIGVKVPMLKRADNKIAAIHAFEPGRIATLYEISEPDARYLLRAMGVRGFAPGRRHEHQPDPQLVGAGFGSLEQNLWVEAAAVAEVTRYLRAARWSVKDVSARNVGYDLLCTRAGDELHVEVKGVSGQRAQFLMTAHERRHWERDPEFALGLVRGALTTPRLSLFRGSASLANFRVTPLAYRCTLRTPQVR